MSESFYSEVIPTCYGTRNFITLFITSRQSTLSWAR